MLDAFHVNNLGFSLRELFVTHSSSSSGSRELREGGGVAATLIFVFGIWLKGCKKKKENVEKKKEWKKEKRNERMKEERKEEKESKRFI